MDRYPVAGSIIGFELWFGLTLRDIAETLLIPFLMVMVPRVFQLDKFIGIDVLSLTLFGLVGLVFGIIILLLKNDGQRPLEYLQAALSYYLTTNEYLKRENRNTNMGDVQDVPISQIESSVGSTENDREGDHGQK